jgi:PAS domain S-box-containing protein
MAIEAAPTGMLMVDRGGLIVMVNAQIERLFGYLRQELIGQPVEMLVPLRFRPTHAGFRSGFLHEPETRPMGAGRDLYGLRKDGSEIRIEIGLNPLRMPDGDFVLGSVADVTDRLRAEEEREQLLVRLKSLNAELTRSLNEREVLLQEVHHRVKNNLQVVSSLINMQVRKLKSETGRDALEECQTRVQAIALIHEQLYQSKDYARVPFSQYVRSLASMVFDTVGISQAVVRLELRIEDVSLAVDRAIPCGLILNELITNALKHGFPEGRIGYVRVELRRQSDGQLLLGVEDDGVGLAERVDVERSTSLGLQLVRTLTEQLDGQLEVERAPTTAFRLTFREGATA